MGKAVLWIHGLGDSGAGWEGAFRIAGVRFHHPTAPIRPVTCNGGSSCTSWFDIDDIPVRATEREPPKDIEESAKSIHGMLDQIEKEGTPAESIVLGGFSQGGTLSLLAGLSYPKRLAGVVSISGWCAKRSDMSWVSEAAKQTPVLMCCGDGDPVVDFSVTKLSADLLREVLGDNITVLAPKRPMHQPSAAEDDATLKFMKQQLSVS
eukprot:TRINITY_DN109173_c0_g1_i1.p1 TRINITY_DN109173_c0_g1~~TRINITY_DN109173_c0_g1_i1.p1  ORF type:complete len:207 (-),score=42.38 TRINITY_DN109173_c0_g1_i1:61-681(-)